ncbi:MAG: cobalamin biosynthesis protein [Rhodobacteraceae bacterium]|nr:cobalamin biosynthesis protein [Paracoccaceae bacterium]
MSFVSMLLIALILDAVFGEPDWLWSRIPHPAALMGRGINWLDEALNKGSMRQAKGILAIAVLSITAVLIGAVIQRLPDFGVLEIIFAAILLAHRSLTQHVEDVAVALRSGLSTGRESVSMIVGRDSKQLDESGVARSAIESAAENFSDGVVAPAFWFLLLGLPGILLYKVVNTADSMVGYKNREYAEFGFGAAKLDDLLNWVPARITAAMICLINLDREAFETARVDADLHRSPNAGWPEAAMAGVLGVALSGPRSYEGKMTEDPYINSHGKRQLGPADIEDSVAILNRTWLCLVAVLGFIALVFWIF